MLGVSSRKMVRGPECGGGSCSLPFAIRSKRTTRIISKILPGERRRASTLIEVISEFGLKLVADIMVGAHRANDLEDWILKPPKSIDVDGLSTREVGRRCQWKGFLLASVTEAMSWWSTHTSSEAPWDFFLRMCYKSRNAKFIPLAAGLVVTSRMIQQSPGQQSPSITSERYDHVSQQLLALLPAFYRELNRAVYDMYHPHRPSVDTFLSLVKAIDLDPHHRLRYQLKLSSSARMNSAYYMHLVHRGCGILTRQHRGDEARWLLRTASTFWGRNSVNGSGVIEKPYLGLVYNLPQVN
ncbi:hypothetical protein F4778DRAFT_749739 [Xylariomycetidae sp. FL2044]|nr:hypothetical protein F4778DRAFT_749739 [Xylariomycetidae sp. FL2044]